jgi:Flp pilus assembly protein TadG
MRRRILARLLPHREPDERGAILVTFALLLVLLIALSGFAVDFMRWSRDGTRQQKAADAAALAGAVYMPDDFASATTAARGVSSRNGFTHNVGNTVVTVTRGARSNQIRVAITRTVKNFFGAIVGVGSTEIRKEALAEYQRAVNMGSPSNQFGNDPDSTPNAVNCALATYRCFWASIAGPNTDKVQGDAVSSNPCQSSGTSASDNCTGGVNTEFDARGYFYGVDVLAGATGPLLFQAFDPAFVEVGSQCGSSTNGSNLSGAATLTAAQIPHYPASAITPATRFNSANNSPYCMGDQCYSNCTGGYTPPTTTYFVRGPDDSPWDPTDNPILCSVSFPGYRDDIRTALSSGMQTPTGQWFAEYFRQWANLCSVPVPEVGTYFVQVTTGLSAAGTALPTSGSSAGHGQNRFSLRVGLNGNMTTPLAHTFGEGRMSIYANVDGNTATLYLARIMPGASGRTVELSLFDAGDLQGTGTVQVVPAADATVTSGTLTAFTGCTYTAPPGNASGPPWGTFTNTGANCTLQNVSSSSYQGDWVSVRIPIPGDYNCNTSSPSGCWATVRYNFAGATSVTDTTTWTARIRGVPVRLIE